MNGQWTGRRDKKQIAKLLISGSLQLVVGRSWNEHSLKEELEQLRTKVDRLTKERESLKGDNLRLKHRISYLEDVCNEPVRSDDRPLQYNPYKAERARNDQIRSTEHKSDESDLYESDQNSNRIPFRSDLARTDQRPVRQKPPRTSKLKAADPAVTVPAAGSDSGSRIKSSIVDRHFGHVIRVTTHHHHVTAGRTTNRMSPALAQSDLPESDHQSDETSLESLRSDRQVTYCVTHQASPVGNQGSASHSSKDKEQVADTTHHQDLPDRSYDSSSLNRVALKPVPPRKPSFLFINRSPTLQSSTQSLNIQSLDRYPKPESADSTITNSTSSLATAGRETWTNAGDLKKTSALKWSIVSSSRLRNGGASHQ